jgi:hypothetical protein
MRQIRKLNCRRSVCQAASIVPRLRIFAGFRVIEYWPGETRLRDNSGVGQMSFFTAARTVSMRDRTKRRNYSAEAEEFRREQSVRRSWGLEQRHARKMSRQYGSVAAAWTAYQDRVDELQAAASSARPGEAALAVSAGTGDMTEVGKGLSDPVRSVVAAPAQAAAVPLTAEAIESVPVTSPAVLAQPVTAEPATAIAIRSGVLISEPVLSRAPTSEPNLPETVLAEPIPAEADLSAQVRPEVSEHVAAGSRPDRRVVAAFGGVSRASPRLCGAPEPGELRCRCPGWWTGRPSPGRPEPDTDRATSPRPVKTDHIAGRTDRAAPERRTPAAGIRTTSPEPVETGGTRGWTARASPGRATRVPGTQATLLGHVKADRAGQRRHVGARRQFPRNGNTILGVGRAGHFSGAGLFRGWNSTADVNCGDAHQRVVEGPHYHRQIRMLAFVVGGCFR